MRHVAPRFWGLQGVLGRFLGVLFRGCRGCCGLGEHGCALNVVVNPRDGLGMSAAPPGARKPTRGRGRARAI